MTHSERDTFLTTRELLARAIDYSAAVAHRLGRADGVAAQSRTALLQDAYRSEQVKLTTSLERYADEAPPEILDTFAQYSIWLPDALPEPALPFTPESLTQWMLDVNKALGATFSEIADAVVATPAHDVFENLAELVRTFEKHIVQAADGAQDL